MRRQNDRLPIVRDGDRARYRRRAISKGDGIDHRRATGHGESGHYGISDHQTGDVANQVHLGRPVVNGGGCGAAGGAFPIGHHHGGRVVPALGHGQTAADAAPGHNYCWPGYYPGISQNVAVAVEGVGFIIKVQVADLGVGDGDYHVPRRLVDVDLIAGFCDHTGNAVGHGQGGGDRATVNRIGQGVGAADDAAHGHGVRDDHPPVAEIQPPSQGAQVVAIGHGGRVGDLSRTRILTHIQVEYGRRLIDVDGHRDGVSIASSVVGDD